jgi:hypothetical protein
MAQVMKYGHYITQYEYVKAKMKKPGTIAGLVQF